jgi:hypothetical protein
MALIPLNTFKTKTAVLTTNTSATIYTAPVGVTSIVLMSQIANTGTATASVTFVHHRNIQILPDAQGNGAQPGNVDSYLVRNFGLPADDAVNVLSGKLIIETLDSIRAYSDSPGACTLVLSILESANQ